VYVSPKRFWETDANGITTLIYHRETIVGSPPQWFSLGGKPLNSGFSPKGCTRMEFRFAQPFGK
jgi:hypothetical protein